MYNYRNFETKCNNNNFWNSYTFYNFLRLYTDKQLKEAYSGLSFKQIEIGADKVSAEEFGCQNVVKKVSISSILSTDFKIQSLNINIYYQTYSEDTTIVFEYLPKVAGSEQNGYFVQNRGGYIKNTKLVFGKQNNDTDRLSINTLYPLSYISIVENNNACSLISSPDEVYKKPLYLNFLVNQTYTCQIDIAQADFESFCNSFDSNYNIFSIVIRNIRGDWVYS